MQIWNRLALGLLKGKGEKRSNGPLVDVLGCLSDIKLSGGDRTFGIVNKRKEEESLKSGSLLRLSASSTRSS